MMLRSIPVLVVAIVVGLSSGFAREAALPQRLVDTQFQPPMGGTLWRVAAAAELQDAFDRCQPGDIIELRAGVSLTGNFVVRQKAGDQWIYVRSSQDAALPPPEQRVGPEHASVMGMIVSPNVQPALRFEEGAHHYRFVGLEITTTHATTSFTNWNLVLMGSTADDAAATSVEQLPHHITFDRCYLHGTPTGNVRRGILLEGSDLAVIECYLADFHEIGADSQALCGTNGPGPFKICNNYLSAAGENVMFGGMKPAIPELVPADIEVRHNHFSKPFRWRIDHPEYAGIPWTVKNLFELKNARRVLVEGNLFEHCWGHAQEGGAILFTPRAHGAPWTIVEDVTFRHNMIRSAASGIGMLATDSGESSEATRRIVIRDNLIYDINAQRYGGNGFLFQLSADDERKPIEDLIVEHNTALHSSEKGLIFSVGPKAPAGVNFVFRSNLVTYGAYGFHGDDLGGGSAALDHYFPGGQFRDNLIITYESDLAAIANSYPADNLFATIDRQCDLVRLSREALQRLYQTPLGAAQRNRRHPGADLNTLYREINLAVRGQSASAE